MYNEETKLAITDKLIELKHLKLNVYQHELKLTYEIFSKSCTQSSVFEIYFNKNEIEKLKAT